MANLEQEKNTAFDNFKAVQTKMQELVTPFIATSNKIKVSVNSLYGAETIINLEHEDFNWTNFLTVNIAQKKELTYSHGSGGFNEGTTTEQQLKSTEDMFLLVHFYIQKKDEIERLAIEISKAQRTLSIAHDRIEEQEKQETLEKATNELLKTHRHIDTDEILETIKEGGSVFVTKIHIETYNGINAKLYELEVENRGSKRANYYFNNSHYSKDSLINSISSDTLYVAQ